MAEGDMSANANEPEAPVGLVEEVIAAIQRADDAPRPPPRHDWAAWFPQLRTELEEYFDDRDQLDAWLEPLRQPLATTSVAAQPALPTPGAATSSDLALAL